MGARTHVYAFSASFPSYDRDEGITLVSVGHVRNVLWLGSRDNFFLLHHCGLRRTTLDEPITTLHVVEHNLTNILRRTLLTESADKSVLFEENATVIGRRIKPLGGVGSEELLEASIDVENLDLRTVHVKDGSATTILIEISLLNKPKFGRYFHDVGLADDLSTLAAREQNLDAIAFLFQDAADSTLGPTITITHCVLLFSLGLPSTFHNSFVS
jgi:hypothetical protein